MPEHSDVPLGENHRVANWEFVDAAARTGATGILPAEVGRWAKQLNDGSYWELIDDSPLTWEQRTGAGAGTDTEAVQDIVGALIIDSSSIDAIYDDVGNIESLVVKDGAPPLSPATVPLTDGATITWATAGARQNNARVTLGGNRTLDVTGEVDGATGLLIVKQDGTGNRTLTLPGSSLVINGGGGAVTLSTGADELDILTWYFDGTNFYWTIGKDYS